MSNNDYDKVAHLGFIQGAINRMAGNSLRCKTWALTLFSALTAFFFNSEKTCTNPLIFWLIVTVMLGVFWWMDSWYLWMERLFRKLYDQVRLERGEPSNPYTMSFAPFIKDEDSILRIMFSLSTCPVYFPLMCVALPMLINAFAQAAQGWCK